jgi:hypothetical protein
VSLRAKYLLKEFILPACAAFFAAFNGSSDLRGENSSEILGLAVVIATACCSPLSALIGLRLHGFVRWKYLSGMKANNMPQRKQFREDIAGNLSL